MSRKWCEKCYEKLSNKLNSEYGEGNWRFSNIHIGLDLATGEFLEFLTPLKIKFHRIKANGKRSRYVDEKDIYFTNCPFCGGEIRKN